MDDLISRQAAIDALHMDTSIIPFEKAREYADATISEIRNRLEKLPSAQPEIIYCKDCGHRDDHGCCKYWKGLAMSEIPIATDDYDFCCHAKRGENE